MDYNYQFIPGQRVRAILFEPRAFIFGNVTAVTEDAVYIKWEDVGTPCKHENCCFGSIYVITKQ